MRKPNTIRILLGTSGDSTRVNARAVLLIQHHLFLGVSFYYSQQSPAKPCISAQRCATVPSKRLCDFADKWASRSLSIPSVILLIHFICHISRHYDRSFGTQPLSFYIVVLPVLVLVTARLATLNGDSISGCHGCRTPYIGSCDHRVSSRIVVTVCMLFMNRASILGTARTTLVILAQRGKKSGAVLVSRL